MSTRQRDRPSHRPCPDRQSRARDLYKQALELARQVNRPEQVFYNGVNAAYLGFALGEPDFAPLAEEVLDVCVSLPNPDYWSEATRAECLLLLRRYPEAGEAYASARRHNHEQRHWTSTGQQALDILKRQSDPEEGKTVAGRFRQIRPDFQPAALAGG